MIGWIKMNCISRKVFKWSQEIGLSGTKCNSREFIPCVVEIDKRYLPFCIYRRIYIPRTDERNPIISNIKDYVILDNSKISFISYICKDSQFYKHDYCAKNNKCYNEFYYFGEDIFCIDQNSLKLRDTVNLKICRSDPNDWLD